MDVFISVPETRLTTEQKKKALSAATFIEEKCNNQVKGIVCANGRK